MMGIELDFGCPCDKGNEIHPSWMYGWVPHKRKVKSLKDGLYALEKSNDW